MINSCHDNSAPIILFLHYKMNEIVKIFLLAGYKFLLEMHLRELAALVKPNFTYSTCRPYF